MQLEQLLTLLAQGRDGDLLRYGLGEKYFAQGDYVNAIEHLQKAIVFNSNYSAAYKLLAKCYQKLGHNEQALSTFEQAYQIAKRAGDMQNMREIAIFIKRLQKG